jgi:hypothetical protein
MSKTEVVIMPLPRLVLRILPYAKLVVRMYGDSSDFVEMEFSTELQNWKCPRCGGTERMKARTLTPAYIRKIQDKVLQKREDVFKYLPNVFEKVKSMYNYIISKNKEDFWNALKNMKNWLLRIY